MLRRRTRLLLLLLPALDLFAQSAPAARPKQSTLPSDLVAKVRKDLKLPEKQSCLDGHHLSLEQAVSTQWMMLNDAAGPSLLVKGLAPCLADGANGPLLVYGQFYDGWRKILDGTGRELLALRARSKGWGDLELWEQQSASDSIRRSYRFDGYEYKAAGCEMLQLADRTTGKPLPKPISSRCPKQ
jgi:hypothetical protein